LGINQYLRSFRKNKNKKRKKRRRRRRKKKKKKQERPAGGIYSRLAARS